MSKFGFQPRYLADLLTLSRVSLSLSLIFLGTQSSPQILPQVVLIVLLSWFTDLIDGPIARKETDLSMTIIGAHDKEADLATSVGVTVYLVLAGHIPAAAGLVFLIFLTRIWFWHSHQLAWPLYALPYAFLLILAFNEAPGYGRLMGTYILAVLVISWPRLNSEFLPEFFEALQSVLQHKE